MNLHFDSEQDRDDAARRQRPHDRGRVGRRQTPRNSSRGSARNIPIGMTVRAYNRNHGRVPRARTAQRVRTDVADPVSRANRRRVAPRSASRRVRGCTDRCRRRASRRRAPVGRDHEPPYNAGSSSRRSTGRRNRSTSAAAARGPATNYLAANRREHAHRAPACRRGVREPAR